MNNIYIRVKETPELPVLHLLLDNEDYVLVSLSQMLFLVEKKMSGILHFIPGGRLTVLGQLRSEETISSALKCANTSLLKVTNQISTTRRANVLRPV